MKEKMNTQISIFINQEKSDTMFLSTVGEFALLLLASCVSFLVLSLMLVPLSKTN